MGSRWDKFRERMILPPEPEPEPERAVIHLQRDGLSPLAVRFSANPEALLAVLGQTLDVPELDALPITAGATRFIQSKISAMPRRLINRSTGVVSSRRPRWLDQANPVNSFTSELNSVIAGLLWDGEVFIKPVVRRGQVEEVWTYRASMVSQASPTDRGYVSGAVRWRIGGVVDPTLIQIKVGERANDLRGHGIREFGQDILQAYRLSLLWTNKLYRGKLMQLLTGDFSHMTEQERQAFRDSIDEKTAGVDNVGRLLFVPSQTVDVKTLSFDAQQMQHKDILRELAQMIVTQLFGIPAQMFNLNQSGTQITYTTVPALSERLYQDCLLYYITAIEDGYSRMFRLERLDLDERRMLAGSVSDMTQRAKVMTEINSGGRVFTDQEVRETAGFEGWPEELDVDDDEPDDAIMEVPDGSDGDDEFPPDDGEEV